MEKSERGRQDLPTEDDGEIRVLNEHDLLLHRLLSHLLPVPFIVNFRIFGHAVKGERSSYLDGPSTEVGNSREAVEARCCVLGNKVVLLCESTGHVAGTVAGFHLRARGKR